MPPSPAPIDASTSPPQAPEAPPDVAPPVWRMFLLLVSLLVVGSVIALLARGGSENGVAHPAVGMPLPYFEAAPLAGGEGAATLDTLRGQVAVINYWGPWCHFCLREMPHLAQLASERQRDDFRLVLVLCENTSGRTPEEVAENTAATLARYGDHLVSHNDPTAANRQTLIKFAQLDGFGYPTTVVLDRTGVVRGLWVGYREGDERDLAALVDRLLAES